jgi:uncharacterized protein (TIGR00290 family)
LKKALVSWSGGKDAAWSLHRILGEYEIAALLCTVSESEGIVPVHNVPQSSIAAQAAALGISLWTVPLPQPCPNTEYAARLQSVWVRALSEGIETVVFGDLFLSDIRAWREQLLSDTGVKPVFPLWLEPTDVLAREMISGGLKASVCAVDRSRLPTALIGQSFDEAFLARLPAGVDPCGENGEFHTFVSNMPEFTRCAESFL